MDRRKFLVGMGSLAAGGAAVMGTGAFDNVQAEGREVSVNVANDGNALLGLDASTGQYSELASYDGNGQITVDVSGMNTAADGVNPDSGTFLFDIFRVRNQGKDDAIVYVDPDSVEFSGGAKAADRKQSGDYIDPQATQRPNGGDLTNKGPQGHDTVSLTGVYNFASDPQGFASDADSTFSNFGGRNIYRLDSGQQYAFGLYIREGFNDGDDNFPDVSMTFVGDTSVV
jgi:hypothetical protein